MSEPPVGRSPSHVKSFNGGGGHLSKDRRASIDGYSSNIFEGKPEQMKQVAEFIVAKGFLPKDLVETEVVWFYKYTFVRVSLYLSLRLGPCPFVAIWELTTCIF